MIYNIGTMTYVTYDNLLPPLSTPSPQPSNCPIPLPLSQPQYPLFPPLALLLLYLFVPNNSIVVDHMFFLYHPIIFLFILL